MSYASLGLLFADTLSKIQGNSMQRKLRCAIRRFAGIALLLMGTPVHAANVNTILGNVDGVVTNVDGSVVVRGWACWKTWSGSSPRVDLYVGGEYGHGGIKLGTYWTDQLNEPAIDQVCETKNTPHRFVITLTISMRQQYAGKAVYLYGVPYPTFNNYTLLSGSGQFTVPAAPTVADSVYYIQTDRLGSNVIMTDANANVVAKTDYKAYGSAADNQQKNEAPGYIGHYEDPLTGLTYMQQRYYDADLGRFLSIDPVASRPGDVFNFNRYAYANNNPLVFVDPDGRDAGNRAAVIVNGFYRDERPRYYDDGGWGSASFGGVRGPAVGGASGGGVHTEKPVNVTANTEGRDQEAITLSPLVVTANLPPDQVYQLGILPPPIFRLPQAPPIFRTPWYKPLLRKADDLLSDQLVKKLSNKTLTISKTGRPMPVPTPWVFFLTAMIHSPDLGGCNGEGRCADEYNSTMPPPVQ